MDQKQPVLHLLTVLLFLFFFLSLAGSRALKNQEAAGLEESQAAGGDKMPVEEEGFAERRIDFESMDYPGSGANSRHDPRSPGRP